MARKKIDNDIQVDIVNNLEHPFIYRSKQGTDILLETKEDSDSLTVKELRSFSSGTQKRNLKNFLVLISYVDDDDVTLEDVLEYLKLDEHYSKAKAVLGVDEDEVLEPEHFEAFALTARREDIEKMINELPELLTVITEQLIKAYKENKADIDATQQAVAYNGIKDPYALLEDLRADASFFK